MPLNLGLNAAFAAGSQLLGIRNDPYISYNFLVEIEGLLTGGFMEVTGLDSEIQLEEYQEGGMNNYVHKFPTRTVYPNLVLTRGLTAIDTLWNWYWAATQGVIVQLSGTIMLLDRKRLPITWWNFKDAYPVKWVGPQFNASSDSQVAVERIELVHRGISKPLVAQAAALARTVV
jgi:phage tail-like protein